MAGLATTVLVAGFVGLGSAKLVADEAREDEATRAQVARMAAQVEALKAGTAALEGQVRSTVERIEARQRFLDALLTGKARGRELAELIPPAGRARVSGDAAREAGVLAPFARLEAQQLALVDKAAATAETRLKDLQALLRRLGLDQERFLALSMPRIGVGGPFVPAAAVGPDPRFAELYVSWQRLEQLEEALASIPAFLPVERFTLTSGFGFRFDPFSGTGAQHLGVDLAGAHGEPIRAAAAGTVVRAERFGAYGLTVDVDHGRGFLTRYAHLSRIDVRLGDRVAMGQRIGAMGSTGRSTGTHLHYEIRVDGRPVNPRPFLDSSRYILAAQGSDPGL
ncbi:MAG: M23 family metallopeptidase [Sphingomonadaceae bacterium]|nr:M23 family metallopeptidase [Sphingomonadaceae bacterium]MDW8414780.1 M23 family metallopeptidase [Thermaurantiacus sp.]